MEKGEQRGHARGSRFSRKGGGYGSLSGNTNTLRKNSETTTKPNRRPGVVDDPPKLTEITMASKVKPIPVGYHTITPYLIVEGAEKLIDFTQKAFGAEFDHEPAKRPDGKIMHATLKIGDSMLMVAEASEHAKATSVMLYLYVPDVDAAYQMALKAGVTSVMEPADQFYGDRSGRVKDAAGNQWFFGTHIEDLSPAEMKKRTAEFFKQKNKAA
jgi:PhnB protein